MTLDAGLTAAAGVLAVVLLVLALAYAARDRLVDDLVLALAVLLVVVVSVRGVRGLIHLGEIPDTDERATFAAYIVSLPVIPLMTVFLAIKEKTRWAMLTVAVGAFAVGVMAYRVEQIWSLRG